MIAVIGHLVVDPADRDRAVELSREAGDLIRGFAVDEYDVTAP